ncbi:Imm51 family immunity protein [Streptomyces sp. 5.8]|uniref:Imm51 family immunity protein n=1 Tax=Streptomyces sp. 5.8 TaxID=3406571 RepID=UPI003BB56496
MEQVADVFEEHNAERHGHGWDGLAQSVAHSQMPENGDKLQYFGSEAGTFVGTSPDLKALTDLAAFLHSAFDWVVAVDSPIVRAHQHAAGARQKAPRTASPPTMPLDGPAAG